MRSLKRVPSAEPAPARGPKPAASYELYEDGRKIATLACLPSPDGAGRSSWELRSVSPPAGSDRVATATGSLAILRHVALKTVWPMTRLPFESREKDL